MSNALVPTGGLFPAKLDRQVSRALAQIDASAAVARHADLARLERIASTTQHGMIAVSHLAAVEAALAQVTPHAAERIHAVAVAGTLSIAGVVYDAGRSL
jgi:hypothetical protein